MEPRIYRGKNGKDFALRLAVTKDFPESIRTFATVASEKIYLNTEEVSPDINEVWKKRWTSNGQDQLFCVVETEGRLAGGIVLNKYSGSPKTSHVLELGMWITSENRGQGMGSAMMDYALEWARKTPGIRKIVLGVWNSNTRAISLYSKFGFCVEGSHRNIAKIHGKYVDEILMAFDFEDKN